MNSKTEQIILGIIILLVGILLFLQRSITLDVANISLAATGFAFVLLYRTKRKSWSLVLGVYLMYLCVSGVLINNLPSGNSSESLVAFTSSSFLLMITGALLLILFYDKRRNGLLIPGVLAVGLSVNNLLKTVLLVSSPFSFLLILGICFFIIYKLGSYFLGKWPLYLSILLFGVSALRLVYSA